MKTFHRFGPVLLAGGLAALFPAPSPAQSQAELVARHEDKLDSEFLKKASWITDYDAAREEARKTGKPIFAYFTRSYAH